MTRPAVDDTTEILYDELAVTQPADEDAGWPLLILLAAIAAALGELPGLVRDTDDGPGWTGLMDPDRAPAFALPWLAQLAGVRLTTGLPEAEQRAQISAPPAFQRGTPAAMRAAVQNTLTGSRFVDVLERVSGDPYAIEVVVLTGETPDPAASEAAARSQKPAGLILTFTINTGAIINQGSLPIDSVTAGVTIDAATLGDVT
jgi:hypothetical protein